MSVIGAKRRNIRLDGEAAAIAFFKPIFARERAETLRIAHLDGEHSMIGLRLYESDLCHAVEFPLRTIIRDAIELDSVGLILAHNHPSGDAAPSRQDLLATRALISLMRPLGMRIHDHLIFARSEVRSFRAMGLL